MRAYLHVVEATTHVLVPLSVNGYQHHPLVLGFAPPDVCARAGLSLDRVPTVMHAFPPSLKQMGSRADQVREDAIENPVSPAELAEFLSVPLSALERRPQRSCLRSHTSDAGSHAGSHSGSLRTHTSSSHAGDASSPPLSSPPHSASLRHGGSIGGGGGMGSGGVDSPSPASPSSASLHRRDSAKATRRTVSLDPSPQILDVTHSPSLYEYHSRVIAAEQQTAARAALSSSSSSSAAAAVVFAPTSPGASNLGVATTTAAATTTTTSSLVAVALSSPSASTSGCGSVAADTSSTGAVIARHARFAQLAAQEHATERRAETALHQQHEADKTTATATTTAAAAASRASLTPLAIAPKAASSASTTKTVAARRSSDDSGGGSSDGGQPDTDASSASDESGESRTSTMLTDVRFGGGDVGAAANDASGAMSSGGQRSPVVTTDRWREPHFLPRDSCLSRAPCQVVRVEQVVAAVLSTPPRLNWFKLCAIFVSRAVRVFCVCTR